MRGGGGAASVVPHLDPPLGGACPNYRSLSTAIRCSVYLFKKKSSPSFSASVSSYREHANVEVSLSFKSVRPFQHYSIQSHHSSLQNPLHNNSHDRICLFAIDPRHPPIRLRHFFFQSAICVESRASQNV